MTKNFKKLAYFRSDTDLSNIFNYFAKSLSVETENDFFITSAFMKSFSLKTIGSDLEESFKQLLAAAVTRNRENWVSDKALSHIIALTNHIIPPEQANAEIIALLNECLNHSDHRTCANAILVLGEFSKNSLFLREFMYSSNNRVSADAMLVTGKQKFDSELALKLESYIKSKNPLLHASGVFVAHELIAYYETADPVFFESNKDLQRIFDLIPEKRKNVA